MKSVIAGLRSYLLGWKEYFRLADTPGVCDELDKWIRHRLRAIHLKQWKRGTTIYRELRARGLSEHGAAKVAANGRRWWKNSGMLIHVAFPVRYFDELGFTQTRRMTSTLRTARCGPACRVVWQGTRGITWGPYADCAHARDALLRRNKPKLPTRHICLL